ncbi:glycosyltransferase family 2 protein [Nocardioides sp. TRM66260-LWL]|uniref:glycosyltransferase family 2 protein n=1 Tax=Nocardioides sp. TRM66260-LWL TaxID=2874478 RepID=UPI001CC76531|nr:glycosyltransferase family 2 protein [Nocardioides sp. TRM66260-LWL]MBZ5735505.1 glycosyltransferase family 2 protein [Nocardioides sp. TRM66260-LWL]
MAADAPDAQEHGARPAPPVSVVMPVLNEERYLAQSVQRVLDQAYDGPMEVVLAVGPSRDRTAEIAAGLAADDPRIRVVDNPTGRTPHALNAAIGASSHAYVVRVDAHGLLPDGYVRDVVALLETTGAANVGGLMHVEGETDFGHAVAVAMSSPYGIGGAKFHVGGQAGPADTVYLGAFRRDVLTALGGYDEQFTRAQDWELNYRIRKAGHTIWFSPDLAVTYRPRRDLRALATQFHGSGRWRRQIIAAYPDTASFRYLAAPVVTLAIGVGVLLGLVGLLGAALGAGPLGWLTLGLAVPLVYALGVVAVSLREGRGLSGRARLWLPVVIVTMHLAWGSGFLRSVPRAQRAR